MKKITLTFLLALGCLVAASAQQVAVKSNLLYWMTGTFNAGAEVALSDHSTLGATVNYNPWTFRPDNRIQHWFVRPEYRYWITGTYTRLYLGAHLMGGQFEVGGFPLPFIGNRVFEKLKTNYYTGHFIAAGLSIGYQFYISPHWNLELSAGAGFGRVQYRREPLDGSKPSGYNTRILPMPTEIGLSFVYLFNARKK